MDDNEHPHEPSEPSEATMIVDSNVLKQARTEASERDQAYVIVIAGPHTGKMFKLDEGDFILGRSPKVDIQLQDVGVSRTHAKVFRVNDQVFVEDMKSANGTYLNGERLVVTQQLSDGDKITLGSTTILKFTYHDRLDEDYQKRMFNAALRDGLTGAFNKKYLLNHLRSEFSYAQRHQNHLSLLLFDIDHFKEVNDTYGHLAGDHILVKLSSLVMNGLRTEDTFARYGGEEFAVVARGSTMFQAYQLAERLRRDVADFSFVHNGDSIPITISIGVSSFPENTVDSIEELIQAADTALYGAKNGGRNRTEMAQSP